MRRFAEGCLEGCRKVFRVVRGLLSGLGGILLLVVILPALYLQLAARIDWEAMPPLSPVPGAMPLPAPPPSARIHMHLHTEVSHDAVGTRDEVATAARREGVDGVWIADHLPRVPGPDVFAEPESDPWREGGLLPPDVPAPQPPERRQGVLLVDGREFTIARGVGRVLLFEADTVFARWDGGLGPLRELVRARPHSLLVATHGRGPRDRDLWFPGNFPELHACEVLTISDAARRRLEEPEILWRLPAALFSLSVGRFDRPLAATFEEGFDDPGIVGYDSLSASGPLAMVAAGNAHPKTRVFGRLVPPYRASMRVASTHLLLDSPLADDPHEATRQVHRAFRAQRSYVSLQEGDRARAFQFRVSRGDEWVATIGDEVEWEEGLVLHGGFARPLPGGLIFRVVRNGERIVEGRGRNVAFSIDLPGVYRVEAERYLWRFGRLLLGRRPWITTSPIRITRPTDPAPEAAPTME